MHALCNIAFDSRHKHHELFFIALASFFMHALCMYATLPLVHATNTMITCPSLKSYTQMPPTPPSTAVVSHILICKPW